MATQRFDFTGRLDGKTVLADGSVRYTARLTRTGVFDYGDHKELRLPEDVFAQKSLDSFKGLTVTDGHQAFVDPSNWKSLSKGHVGDDVRGDGKFVVASVIVKDAGMIEKIDAGDRAELSMGYTVNLDARSGEYEGERYDAIQRDIVGNHAALGPVGWGRAGGAVRLLDGAPAYAPGVTTPAHRIDAPAATDDTLRKDLDASRADADAIRKERDAARADLDAAKKRADTAEAERDQAKKDLEAAKADAAKARSEVDAKIAGRLTLLDAARAVLGADYAFAEKTDREVRVAAITKIDSTFKADGKSDDYVAARFDLAVESVKKDRGALAGVQSVTTPVPGATPAGEKSRLDEALEKQAAERAEQSKGGPPPGAQVKK